MEYKGYKILTLENEEMADFYENLSKFDDAVTNQYVVVQNAQHETVDEYCYQDGRLRPVKYSFINSSLMGKIKPRNLQQTLAFDMLQDKTTKIKTLTGRYGSGKSFAMLAQGVQLLKQGAFNKIIYVRNNINVKDTVELGALPGTAIDKIYPYAMPLVDHLGGDIVLDEYIDRGKIELVHLGFLRGRDLRNSLVYCTEAQNLSVDHMKLLIGRIGEGSELWLDGDIKQTDRKAFEGKNSGLCSIIDRLAGNELFAYVHLEKSERSEVAALADLLD